jgi:hypothetical protein
MFKKGLLCGILLVLLTSTSVSGFLTTPSQLTRTISISGTIYGLPLNGTGAVPVENAKVALIGGKLTGGITFALESSDPSDANGSYSFTDIPLGIFFLIAHKSGEYLPGLRIVRLTESQPIKVNQDITMLRIGGTT